MLGYVLLIQDKNKWKVRRLAWLFYETHHQQTKNYNNQQPKKTPTEKNPPNLRCSSSTARFKKTTVPQLDSPLSATKLRW